MRFFKISKFKMQLLVLLTILQTSKQIISLYRRKAKLHNIINEILVFSTDSINTYYNCQTKQTTDRQLPTLLLKCYVESSDVMYFQIVFLLHPHYVKYVINASLYVIKIICIQLTVTINSKTLFSNFGQAFYFEKLSSGYQFIEILFKTLRLSTVHKLNQAL